MKSLFRKRTGTNTVRDTVSDKAKLKKAAKASIKDQKNISRQATKLRAQTANR